MKKILFLALIGFSVFTVSAQTVPTKKSKRDLKEAAKTAKPVEAKEVKQEVKQEIKTEPAQQVPTTPPDVNKMFSFTNDSYDFGKIVAGKPAEYELTIKNVSGAEAELTLVQPSCGCTTPKYEAKKKFANGETVKVVLGFNGGSPGQTQTFSKSVTVTLNGTLTRQVSFRGETYAAPAEPAPANPAMEKLKPGNGN